MLFEGSGDYQGNAAPRRDPVFLEKLSDDQIDIIHGHLEEFGKGTASFGVQTDHVIIISTDIEMIDLVNSRRPKMVDKSTDTNDLEKCEVDKKLDKLLTLFQDRSLSSNVEGPPPSSVNKPLEEEAAGTQISDVHIEIIEDSSPSTSNFEQVGAHETHDLVLSPEDTQKDSPTINHQHGLGIKFISEAYASPGSQITESNETVTPKGLPENIIYTSTPENLFFAPQPSIELEVANEKTDSFVLSKTPNITVEISGPDDMCNVPSDANVQIAGATVKRAMAGSSGFGNFARRLTTLVYKKSERVDRVWNADDKSGKVPISPRRKVAVVKAIKATAEGHEAEKTLLKSANDCIVQGLRNDSRTRQPMKDLTQSFKFMLK